ncbi:hypothetical protein C8R41DRAFT_872088 [Lentinula lateritia]|uniref:Uncharacterized protein n=1 Tax=Lentinula lateritia TaxID=40482 RepID=A0ABQ8UYI6_9AGAR|nr:hypothetical protein C8R41DRAFT_872088 [Lentinula lateritia]
MWVIKSKILKSISAQSRVDSTLGANIKLPTDTAEAEPGSESRAVFRLSGISVKVETQLDFRGPRAKVEAHFDFRGSRAKVEAHFDFRGSRPKSRPSSTFGDLGPKSRHTSTFGDLGPKSRHTSTFGDLGLKSTSVTSVDVDDDDMEVDPSSSGASGTRHKAARLRVLSSDEEGDAPLPKKARSAIEPNSVEFHQVIRKGVVIKETFRYLESDEDFDKRIEEETKVKTEESIRWRNSLLEHTKKKLKENPTKGIQDHTKRRLLLFSTHFKILENVEAILDNYCQPDDSIPDKMCFFTPEDLEKLENIHTCLDEEPQDEDVLMDVDTIHNTPETAFLLLQSDEPMLNNELDGLTEDDDDDFLQLPPLDSPPSPPPSNGPSLVDLPEGMVQRSSILAESLTGHEMFTDEPRSAIPKEWIHVPKDASKDETKQTGTDKTASFLSLHSCSSPSYSSVPVDYHLQRQPQREPKPRTSPFVADDDPGFNIDGFVTELSLNSPEKKKRALFKLGKHSGPPSSIEPPSPIEPPSSIEPPSPIEPSAPLDNSGANEETSSKVVGKAVWTPISHRPKSAKFKVFEEFKDSLFALGISQCLERPFTCKIFWYFHTILVPYAKFDSRAYFFISTPVAAMSTGTAGAYTKSLGEQKYAQFCETLFKGACGPQVHHLGDHFRSYQVKSP